MLLFGDWKPVTGQVLASREKPNWTKWHANDPFAPMEYVVEYAADDGSSKRTTLLEQRGKIIRPSIGDTVPLLLDRKSGKVKWDLKNPALDARAARKADEAAENAEFEAKLKG